MLTPASAHTANVRTNVVKPRPSSTPYPAAASATGRSRRQASGTCRRICGAMRRPRASAAPAATAATAATVSAAGPPAPSAAPSSASPPNVIAPPASAPRVNVALASTEAARVRAKPPGASVSTIESPQGDQEPVAPAMSAAASRQAVSTGPRTGST